MDDEDYTNSEMNNIEKTSNQSILAKKKKIMYFEIVNKIIETEICCQQTTSYQPNT